MLSILIPVKNEGGNITKCLSGIFSQDVPKHFEVILIDSGSRDSTLEEARVFPVRIVCIRPEEFHHARTRNFAASLASGECLVFLAGDAYPAAKNWLQELAAPFSDPNVGAVYGRHLPKPGSQLERQKALASLYGDKRIVKREADKQRLGYRYYLFSTVNCAIRRDVWSATQFPDELKIGEDIGIAKRILDRGWKIIYEPNAAVYHSHDYSAVHLFKRYFDLGVVLRRYQIWDGVAKTSMRTEGLRLLRHSFLPSHATVAESLRCMVREAAKYAGILLGRNEQRIPVAIKRRLSRFRVFD
jgi:rhamnosyltransferase